MRNLLKNKITNETVPGTIIQKIVTRPGGKGKHESIAVDSVNPDWCSGLCAALSKGANGRASHLYHCGKYNYDLRLKQGNPMRCSKCRTLFAMPREAA